MISDHGGLFIKILRYTNTTTSKYSSKFFTVVQCLIIVRDSTVTNTCFIMIFANCLFTIKFYNTNTCIVKLTNCVSVALNPFNTKRQAMRQQPHKPILVCLFSSNINFKGVYLQQDIITRPSIVSVHTGLFFTILISFHKISY